MSKPSTKVSRLSLLNGASKKVYRELKEKGQLGGGKGSLKNHFNPTHLSVLGEKKWRKMEQKGGSWSDFTDFFTKTIPNAAKKVGKAVKDTAVKVSDKALVPAGKWIDDRAKQGLDNFKKAPITMIGKLASVTGIPIVKNVGDVTQEVGCGW